MVDIHYGHKSQPYEVKCLLSTSAKVVDGLCDSCCRHPEALSSVKIIESPGPGARLAGG